MTLTDLTDLTDAQGAEHEVECRVTFPEGGPFAAELWDAIPGTPSAAPQGGGVHHIGYWVEDMNTGPSGTVVELCELHSDRPQLRGLFPADSEHAGPPVLDSAL